MEASLLQLLAQLFASPLRLLADGRRLLVVLGRRGQRWKKEIEEPLFRLLLCFLPYFGEPLFAHELDADLREVSDHRLHVTSDVAHLGELGGFDLQKRGFASFARRRAISVLPTP